MKTVVLGLGSNREYDGKAPVQLLAGACHELKAILSDTIFSSVYRTKAMYVTNQEDFYNMVVIGSVPDTLNPFELLNKIHLIEAKLGRNREKEIRFGPRSIDIDIERFENETVSHPDLQIPHLRIKERAFVLIPLLEIFSESADEKTREEYVASLEILKSKNQTGDVEKVVSQEEMLNLISLQAVQKNGRKN